MIGFAEQLRSKGYAIVEGVLNDDAVQRYMKLLANYTHDEKRRGGLRNLLAISQMRELAQSETVTSPCASDSR